MYAANTVDGGQHSSIKPRENNALALARADGLEEPQLAAGALPAWLGDERDPVAQALAAVAIRRIAWPELPLIFEEPAGTARAAARWPHLLAFGMSVEGPSLAVIRPGSPAADRSLAEGTRAAVAVGRELAASPDETLEGAAVAEHAAALLDEAVDTLETLTADGWPSLLADPSGGLSRPWMGADAVIKRASVPDPLELLLG